MKNSFCTHSKNGRSLVREVDRWLVKRQGVWQESCCTSCGRIWRERLQLLTRTGGA